MIRKTYLLLIVMFFGTYMFPKELSADMPENMTCCNTTSPDSCCNTTPAKDKSCDTMPSKASKSCQDSCATCHVCHSFLQLQFVQTVDVHIINRLTSNKLITEYSFPNFKSTSFSIWQPPKLA